MLLTQTTNVIYIYIYCHIYIYIMYRIANLQKFYFIYLVYKYPY
jgi:hypothetical protein